MNKKFPRSYLILFAALFMIMSLSKKNTENLRGTSIALIAPAWGSVQTVYDFLKIPFSRHGSYDPDEVFLLEIENQQLHLEINKLRELVKYENVAASPISTVCLPAHVIYRSAASWNSSLWLDVGTYDNEQLGQEVVAKNSPVVLGTSIVGAIDYVGKRQSRVRLITDSGLSPSVRASRGSGQNQILCENLQAVIDGLPYDENLLTGEQKKRYAIILNELKERLADKTFSWQLAKGELHGSGTPLWRSRNHTLHGIGFNYDFADEYGPARDLRTGAPLEASAPQAAPIPILKVGDLLVTTGMDGVFPADLNVARITKIYPLHEGDYYYELEAHPTAGNLDNLSLVFVIPPIGYDPDDQAPIR